MTTLLQQLHDTVQIALSAVVETPSLTMDAAIDCIYVDEISIRVTRPTLGPVEYVVEVGEDEVEVHKSPSMGLAATAVALEVAKINIELALQDLGAAEEARARAEDQARRAEDSDLGAPDSDLGEACPGCGCMPGDGLTEGCNHPEGCGFYHALMANSDFAFDAARERSYR